MLRKTALILMLSLILIHAIPVAMAAPPAVASPMYNCISSLIATVDIEAGVAICTGTARPLSNDTTAYLEVKLQQLENGTWKTIETWTDKSSNGSKVSAGGNKNVSKGYTYRVQAVVHIYDANGRTLETANATSPVKSY